MTSEIRVNKLTNRIGLSTVTFADSGIGVTVTGRIDPDTDSARDLGTTSVRWRRAYVDEYYGDGSNLTGIAGVSLTNGSNNRVVTATGANALTGESNLTFTGSILTITNSSGASEITLVTPSGNDSGVYFNDGSNAGALTYQHADNSMRFRVNSTEKVRITSAGLVGIGDNSPDRELVVKNASSNSSIKIEAANTHTSQLFFSDTDAENVARISVFHGSGSDQNSMIFDTDGASRLAITSAGNIGIGLITPDTLFHIKDTSNSAMMRLESSSYSSYIAQIQSNNNVGNGSEAGNLYLRGQSGVQMSGNGGTATQFDLDGTSLSITGTTDGVLNLDTSDSRGSFIRFQQGAATEAWVGCGQGMGLGSKTTLGLRSDADIRIRTGTEEHATITTEGYLAVKGQAGNWIYGNHPSNNNFHQFSSSRNGDWMMQFRQEHHNGLGFNLRVNSNNNNEAIALYRENTTNYGFKVYNTGNVQNINNSYGSLSDVSLKENIVDAKSQWNDIKAVKVRNFNLKSDDDKVKMLGVVAQELETVSPKLVFEDKDGVKGVHYSVLYMKAIKALQEAMTRIETLEQDNIALRARITNLEGN